MSPFWRSLWTVGGYLFSIGFLQEICLLLLKILEALSLPVQPVAVPLISIVSVAATFLYIDWRWNWKPEHIGMARTPSAFGWAALGLGLGGAAALASSLVSSYLSGGGISLAVAPIRVGAEAIPVLLSAVLAAFAAEVVFRGTTVSRFQADLSQWELIGAALAAPFLWVLASQLFGMPGPSPLIITMGGAVISVFLTLLFMRTDSVWLSAGLSVGMILASSLLQLHVTDAGVMSVWGAGALILLAMEVTKQRRTPRRVPPRRRTLHAQTVRGPWGPH